MRFRWTPAQQAFRDEVNAFIAANLPPGWDGTEEDDEALTVSRAFTAKLAERRWLAMAWPEEVGGLNAGHITQMLYNEAIAYHRAPITGQMGVAWVGPAVMLYGTPEQKERFLPHIASGEDWWCTLYSEPGSGSDLAALQTRAVADGDEFVISGQKIWTSGAQHANWGWLAARTDPDAPRACLVNRG